MNIDIWTRPWYTPVRRTPRRRGLLGWCVAYSPVLVWIAITLVVLKIGGSALQGVDAISDNLKPTTADSKDVREIVVALASFGLVGLPLFLSIILLWVLLLVSFVSACQFVQRTKPWSLNDAVRVRLLNLLAFAGLALLARIAGLNMNFWLALLLLFCFYGVDLGEALERPGTFLLGGIGFVLVVMMGLAGGVILFGLLPDSITSELHGRTLKLALILAPSIFGSMLYFRAVSRSV